MELPSLAETLRAAAVRCTGEGVDRSRRRFLKLTGAAVAGLSAWELVAAAQGIAGPLIITEKAEGVLLADPSRCVACRRCELACTEFNDGKVRPVHRPHQGPPQHDLRPARTLHPPGAAGRLGQRPDRARRLPPVRPSGPVRQRLPERRHRRQPAR